MSPSSYSVNDFFQAAPTLRDQLEAAVVQLQRRRSDHQQKMTGLRDQLSQTTVQLGYALLPEFTRQACNHAAELTAYAQLQERHDPLGVLEEERKNLETNLATLEAEPAYRDRELLRAPRVGTLTGEILELEDFRRSVAQVLISAEHPRLERLLQFGYGTEQYAVGWWRLSYYEDWKAGDEIQEAFPDKGDFSEVREEVLQARRTIATYDARLAELRAEVAEGEQLEQRFVDTSTRLENLEQIHLDEWRARLIRHMMAMDLHALGDRLAGEQEARLLLQAAHGIQKKIDYLEEIAACKLEPVEQRLGEARQKLERDMVKYRRPKKRSYRFPADKFERRFRDRSGYWDKTWRRYDDAYGTIYAFHRYERASFTEEFLWWDLMTDGRIDSDFIGEVQGFRQAHPDYRWQREGLDDDLAAAASIDADLGDAAAADLYDAS